MGSPPIHARTDRGVEGEFPLPFADLECAQDPRFALTSINPSADCKKGIQCLIATKDKPTKNPLELEKNKPYSFYPDASADRKSTYYTIIQYRGILGGKYCPSTAGTFEKNTVPVPRRRIFLMSLL